MALELIPEYITIDRRRILDRITSRGSPIIVALAPAGYGKTEVAQAVARPYSRRIEFECKQGSPFRAVLSSALGAEGTSPTDICQAWHALEAGVLIIDNLDRLEGAPDEIATVRALLEPHPNGCKVIFCGRSDPGIDFSAFADPHMSTFLRREHLALDEREMKALFNQTSVDDALIYRLQVLTEGWPVPVLYCLRLARSGEIEQLLGAPGDPAFDDLAEYIDSHVIATLPGRVFAGLCAAVGVPGIRPEEIAQLCGERESADAVLDMARRYQVASLRGSTAFDVHALIRHVLRVRHRFELIGVQRAFGDLCRDGRQFARAAQAFLSAGDIETAEDLLKSSRQADGHASFGGFSPIAEIDQLTDLVSHPELWAAVLGARRLSEHPSVLANEATIVLRGLGEGTDPMVVSTVKALVATAFLDNGMIDEANDALVLGDLDVESEDRNDLPMLAARAGIDSYVGAYDRALAVWHRIRAHAVKNRTVFAQLTRIEIRAARARGQWEVEYQQIERMLRSAQESGAVTIVAMALAEGLFGSWLAQESELTEVYQTQLSLLVHEHDLPALLNFNLAALGLPPSPKNASDYWDALGFLIACTASTDPEVCATYARRASAFADASGESFVRVLARVAIAEKIPTSRTFRLEEATEIAAAIDSPALRQSLMWLLENTEPFGMLSPFVNRLRARSTTFEETAGGVRLRIGLGDAIVRRNDAPVSVSEGGWALIATLALEGRPVGRDVLCDRLWETMPLESCYNALKMCVRRTRVQLGAPEAIVSTQGGYALADWVTIDIVEMDQLRASIARGGVLDSELHRISTLFSAMRGGRPPAFSTWEWFAPTEQRLESISREFGQFLGERAIADGEYRTAIDIAEYLIKLDPLDEPARKLLIAALVAADDRPTATREFRYYQKVLKDELDIEPSKELKNLLGA